MSDPPTRPRPDAFVSEGLDPTQIDELRASVAALREHIAARFPNASDASGASEELGDALDASRSEPDLAPEPEDEAGAADPTARPQPAASLLDRLSELGAWELWDRVRDGLGTLGARDRDVETDDFGMDPLYLDRLAPLRDLLFDRWWRVRVSGTDRLPRGEDRVLFVANRSGVLPYDGLMIAEAVVRHRPESPRPRFLVADWLTSLPFAQSRLARVGGVRACPENAERLLRTGRPVIAFPEGQKGALKPFSDRYHLQRFGRGGFVSLAIRAGARVVPVGVVGAEEVHPILLRPGFMERVLGIPLPVTPTFPHLGPLGVLPLPSRWGIRFGDPLPLDEEPEERADDPLYVNRTRERIRSAIQELVDEELRQRGAVFS